MKKISMLFIMFVMSISFAYAKEEFLVQIPTFTTTINGIEFNNEKAIYPLIVYDDITYFPMTYNLCKELGVSTSWHSEEGLYITSGQPVEMTVRGDTGGNNVKGVEYTAKLPNYNIILNGIKMDISNMDYPVLNFRDVTYFPMTWQLIKNELGLDFSWDSIVGLKVSTKVKEISNKRAYFDESIYYGNVYSIYDFPTIYVEPFEETLFDITSTNSQVAYFYNNQIYTLGSGETTFIASAKNGLMAQFKLVVEPTSNIYPQKDNGIIKFDTEIYTIDLNSASLAGKNYVGDMKGIYATISPLTMHSKVADNLTWSSSNPDVATIQGYGGSARVYFNGAGLTIITVTAPNGTSRFIAVKCEGIR